MLARLAIAVFLSTALPAIAAEQGLSLSAPPGTLHGSLLTTAKGAPAILMLAGSGPTDRDGNSPGGITAGSYRLLAEALAARGITTLRIDKRGIAQSANAMTAESDLRFQTYADDARAWAAELRKQTGQSCVWLFGHSEGALVAEVAAQDTNGICGLILASGAGRKAGDLLRTQLGQRLPEPLKSEALADIAELEAGHTFAAPSPSLMALFRPSVQPYLVSWLALDPAYLLGACKLPVLILQGDTDIQVSVDDAKALAAAQPAAKLLILAGVNHMMKLAPPDRAANIATYSDPALPLAPGAVDAVADFVQSHIR